MRWLALALLACLLPAGAQGQATEGQDAEAGPAVTVLFFHPHPDDVDPFGFAWSGGVDAFDARYSGLVVDDGRFDYPYFLADGVVPIEGIPEPGRPFASAVEAYTDAVESRQAAEAPVALALSSAEAGGTAQVDVQLEATVDPGAGLRLLVALAEDPVHYEGPEAFSNGITEHRFTVRAFADLGEQDLSAPAAVHHAFQLDPGWQKDRLFVAAWLQAGAEPLGRFAAREVVQATHAPLGGSVAQQAKGVLAEMYSATWCKPCLHGDLAAEEMAVRMGGAAPLEEARGPRYFQAPPSWLLAALAAVGAAAILGGVRLR